MAPKKQGTPAPTSKEPVVLDKKEAAKVARAEAAEAAKHARIATRAAKSAENKAANAAANQNARDALSSIRALRAEGKLGRPCPPWTESLAEALFELISTGHSMQYISTLEGMPSVFQMLKWRQEPTHPFAVLHTRAKLMLVDLYEEYAQTAAVQPERFVQTTRKQVVTRDGDIVWVTEKREIDNVARSALKVNAYQWTLGHLMPKKHGRNPDPSTGTANEQLKGLFDALMAGPVD